MVGLSGAVWSRYLAYQQRICRSARRLGGRVTCDNEPMGHRYAKQFGSGPLTCIGPTPQPGRSDRRRIMIGGPGWGSQIVGRGCACRWTGLRSGGVSLHGALSGGSRLVRRGLATVSEAKDDQAYLGPRAAAGPVTR